MCAALLYGAERHCLDGGAVRRRRRRRLLRSESPADRLLTWARHRSSSRGPGVPMALLVPCGSVRFGSFGQSSEQWRAGGGGGGDRSTSSDPPPASPSASSPPQLPRRPEASLLVRFGSAWALVRLGSGPGSGAHAAAWRQAGGRCRSAVMELLLCRLAPPCPASSPLLLLLHPPPAPPPSCFHQLPPVRPELGGRRRIRVVQ